MNTLTISDIFANLADYQDQYLSIISNPEQYYTPVESAYIDVWPVGCTDLYLGDLLQLWFSERWLVNSPCQLLSEQSTTLLKRLCSESMICICISCQAVLYQAVIILKSGLLLKEKV